MSILDYLRYFDELKPKVREDFTQGVKLGMWVGGVATLLIFIALRFVFHII